MRIKNVKIGPIASIIILMAFTFFFLPIPIQGEQIVNTDKESYKPGEAIKVNFFNAPGNDRDWICIVPAGAPDTDAGDYKYMPKGLSRGVLTFDSPATGKYEARAYYNYGRNGYVVSGRHAFSVSDNPSSVDSKMAAPVTPPADSERITSLEKSERKPISRGAAHYNVSVFRFTPLNMEASGTSLTATNALFNALKTEPSFEMLDRKELETFLAINDLQQNDQMENAVNIGARMGLNFVIAGTIEKRGSIIVTNCKVIGIDRKKIIFSKHFISSGENNLVSDFKKLGDSIIEAILRTVS